MQRLIKMQRLMTLRSNSRPDPPPGDRQQKPRTKNHGSSGHVEWKTPFVEKDPGGKSEHERNDASERGKRLQVVGHERAVFLDSLSGMGSKITAHLFYVNRIC